MSEQQKTEQQKPEQKNTDSAKTRLFREKSLEAVESPESLNDYLRVTSPGVWLILAAIIALLIGAILWWIFGHIRRTATLPVYVGEDKKVCYAAASQVSEILGCSVITVNGREYPLKIDDAHRDLMTVVSEMYELPEDTPDDLLLNGSLSIGDLVYEVPITTNLRDGYYTGEVVIEDLRPISLLLQ